jgi:hypothetical protein
MMPEQSGAKLSGKIRKESFLIVLMKLTLGVNLIKLFALNLQPLFTLDNLNYNETILFYNYKMVQPSKRVSKFTPKKFDEINSSAQYYKIICRVK